MDTRFWDLPLRVFHWGLAASAVAAFLTGPDASGGRAHVVLGTLAVGLVGFRIGWGVVGEPTARWGAFARSHTRAAALSAGTALALVVGLAVTGVVVLGGEEGRGPLGGVVSPPVGVAVHALHRVLAWTGVAWLAVHLAGVARQSLADGRNLVRGMLDGAKPGAPAPIRARTGVALALVAAAPLVAMLPDDAPTPAPVLAEWASECGDCHLAFPPDLLPARSWERMLASDDHFGEVLGLDPAAAARLAAWASTRSADAGTTEHAVRVAASVPADAVPDRITTLPWWEGVHAAVPLGDEPRTRCADCHPDAERGSFDARSASPQERRET